MECLMKIDKAVNQHDLLPAYVDLVNTEQANDASQIDIE